MLGFGFVWFFKIQINIIVLFFEQLKDMGASFSQTLFLGICAPSPEHRINKLEILGSQIKINNYCSALPPASFPSHHLPSCLPSMRASLGNSSVPDEDRDCSVPVQSSDSTSPAEAQGQHSLSPSLCVQGSRSQPQIRKMLVCGFQGLCST